MILFALRMSLAWTFLHAGLLKIWDFSHAQPATQDFVVAIQQYHLLPSPDLAVLLAVYLPWVEIFAALGLFIRRAQLGAATILGGLTLVFMAALASAWSRGLRIECGCFGRDEVSTDFPALLLRDACILLAALFLFWRDNRSPQTKERSMFGDSGRFTLP
jgi:putative oxidoreductase